MSRGGGGAQFNIINMMNLERSVLKKDPKGRNSIGSNFNYVYNASSKRPFLNSARKVISKENGR